MRIHDNFLYLTEFFFEWDVSSDRSCGEIQKIDFMFNTCFPNLDTVGRRSEILGKFWNVVLEKDGED